jgi:hypothetical protein
MVERNIVLKPDTLLVGRFDFWADEALLDYGRQQFHLSAPVDSSALPEVGEVVSRSYAFLYRPEPAIITRMCLDNKNLGSPDVYTATTGVEGERNFVGAIASEDTLSVDTEHAWGLMGIMEMLRLSVIAPWLGDWLEESGARIAVEPRTVAANPSVAPSMVVLSATAYEAVIDTNFEVLTSWTSFLGSRVATKRSLRVRSFADEFPAP